MKRHTCLTALVIALAGCSTPPVTRLHSLVSTATPVVLPVNAALVIDLAPVGVPAAVDQPQWLVRAGDDTLRLLEQERWTSSPRDELRAALAERLAQGFGTVDVRSLAAGSPQASGTVWRVRVDVQRFETVPGREAWLDSTWSLQTSGPGPRAGAALACRSTLRESAAGDMPSLAEAHRRAVTRLAGQIGTRLLTLQRGQAAACGTPDGP